MPRIRAPIGFTRAQVEILSRLDAAEFRARLRSGRRDGRWFWTVQLGGLTLALALVGAWWMA